MRNVDVLVVGAGITGAAAALALIEAGASVEVVDTYGPAAMGSGWTLAGVRQSGRDPAELPLARAAVALWPELAERLGAPTHYRQEGNLRLARTPDEVAVIERLVETQSAAGLDLTFLPTIEDVRAITPALSERVLAASYCASDGHADPDATVRAFLGAAMRGGARLTAPEQVRSLRREGGRVTEVLTDHRNIGVGAVVLACGIGVNRLITPLGSTIPMRVPIVTVVRTAPVTPMLRPVLGVADASFAARQEAGGALRFTSGAEPFDGLVMEYHGMPRARPRTGQVMETIRRVADVLPAVELAEYETVWGGLLDLTPDGLPVIDRLPEARNVVVAAGFSGHGFGIGPVTGPLAADLALGNAPRMSVDAFRLDRLTCNPDGAEADLTLLG